MYVCLLAVYLLTECVWINKRLTNLRNYCVNKCVYITTSLIMLLRNFVSFQEKHTTISTDTSKIIFYLGRFGGISRQNQKIIEHV